MGPIGGLEILVLLVLAILIGAVVLVTVIVIVTRSRSRSSQTTSTPAQQRTSADRIRELDGLLAEKMISESEYQARRKSILEEI